MELNTCQLAALELFMSGVFNVMYLTGKYGTGKSAFHKYIQANVETLFPGWDLFVCAPTGDAARIASLNGEGVTMQSLFGIGGKCVYPKGKVNYADGLFGRIGHDNATNRFMKRIGSSRKVIIIIDEVMAASAEDLAAIRMILQRAAWLNGLEYKLLCVGHSVQEFSERTRTKTKGAYTVTLYDSPAYSEPRWDNGPSGLHIEPSFFTTTEEWKVVTHHLTQNMRQGDNTFGHIIDKMGDGEVIGEDLVNLLGERVVTMKHGLPKVLPGRVYLTSACAIEARINKESITSVDMIAYPFFTINGVSGHVVDFDAKKCRVKFHSDDTEGDTWYEIPNDYKNAVRDAFEEISTTPIVNQFYVGGQVRVCANNYEQGYRTGMLGVVAGFDGTAIVLDNGARIEYTMAHDIPMRNGARLFELQYLPAFTCQALTTQKAQGNEFDVDTWVLLDAKADSYKPHSFQTAISRVKDPKNLIICVTRADEDCDPVAVINKACVTDAGALNFHNQVSKKGETTVEHIIKNPKFAAINEEEALEILGEETAIDPDGAIAASDIEELSEEGTLDLWEEEGEEGLDAAFADPSGFYADAAPTKTTETTDKDMSNDFDALTQEMLAEVMAAQAEVEALKAQLAVAQAEAKANAEKAAAATAEVASLKADNASLQTKVEEQAKEMANLKASAVTAEELSAIKAVLANASILEAVVARFDGTSTTTTEAPAPAPKAPAPKAPAPKAPAPKAPAPVETAKEEPAKEETAKTYFVDAACVSNAWVKSLIITKLAGGGFVSTTDEAAATVVIKAGETAVSGNVFTINLARVVDINVTASKVVEFIKKA